MRVIGAPLVVIAGAIIVILLLPAGAVARMRAPRPGDLLERTGLALHAHHLHAHLVLFADGLELARVIAGSGWRGTVALIGHTMDAIDENEAHVQRLVRAALDGEPAARSGAREQLLALRERIASGIIEARPGPHCFGSFCPVRTACPEQTGKLARIAEDAKKRLPVLGPIGNDEDCARWHLGIKLLEDVVRQARYHRDEYVRSHVVRLDSDTVLGFQETDKEEIDLSTPEALAAVKAVAPLAVKERAPRVTKSDIEAAARAAQTKRGDGMRVAKELYGRLREMGAMKTNTYSYVAEIKHDKDAA